MNDQFVDFVVRFMDVLWQNAQGFNPAKAVMGPAAFDDHLC